MSGLHNKKFELKVKEKERNTFEALTDLLIKPEEKEREKHREIHRYREREGQGKNKRDRER